jgi:hypothetical protein
MARAKQAARVIAECETDRLQLYIAESLVPEWRLRNWAWFDEMVDLRDGTVCTLRLWDELQLVRSVDAARHLGVSGNALQGMHVTGEIPVVQWSYTLGARCFRLQDVLRVAWRIKMKALIGQWMTNEDADILSDHPEAAQAFLAALVMRVMRVTRRVDRKTTG